MEQPLYSYLDYREYLRDYYRYQKENWSHFSYRYFSQKVGVKAPNFLQWLIEGKRNLSKKTIPAVTQALGFDSEESAYFTLLVTFCQAQTQQEREETFKKLLEYRKPFIGSPIADYQYELFTHWYNEAIRNLLHITEFNPKEKYAFRRLARLLRPSITESEARRSIKLLQSLHLIAPNAEGFLKPTESIISTGDEVQNLHVKKFHTNMMMQATAAMDTIAPHRRDISGITMSVSHEAGAKIKSELQDVRKRILKIVEEDEEANSVMQLNMQLFPLAEVGDDA